MSAETSIASARASVMIYDENTKKWLPSGTSSGLSRVHIYQNTQNNTFRVVGRKLQDHEVVINSAILKNLKYNQATPIFHQWRENRQVYGLNFSAKEDADGFAHTMLKVIDLLNQATYATSKAMVPPQPSQQQPVYGHIGPLEEYGDMRQQPGPSQPNGWHQNGNGMHSMDSNSNAMHHPAMTTSQPQIHQMMGDMHINGSMMAPTQPTYMSTGHLIQQRPPNPSASVAPPVQPPMAPPMPAPVQAAVSAPPPPPPPPGNLMIGSNPMQTNNNGPTNSIPPQAPPVMSAPTISQNNSPPVAPGGAAPPPPPPPPPPGLFGGVSEKPSPSNTNSQPANNLAAAIANARLKRATSIKEGESDNSGAPRTSAPKGGNLMDEMAKTLARRRAQAEKGDQNDSTDSNGPTKFSSTASKSGPEPKVNGFSPSKDETSSVKRNGISDDSTKMNGLSEIDLDRFKQEIMTDLKKELQKFKLDLIDVIKSELNRR